MHRIAVLAVDGGTSFDIAIGAQMFGTAHSLTKPAGALFGEPLYNVIVCAEQRELTIAGWGGIGELFKLTAFHGLDEARTADTIIVPGMPHTRADSPRMQEVLRDAHQNGARIAATSSGAFLLAAAGLLDGRRATVHWTAVKPFSERFPHVEVNSDVLFTDDGDVLTCAGAATCLDLFVHMIRNDFGSAVAADVARHFVVSPQRDGGQAQITAHPDPDDETSLEPTMRWLRDRMGEPITLTEIAHHAAVSPRTLNRRFQEQTGTTPLRWLIEQRVRRAQELLETTPLSIEEIARICGFGTPMTLRQHFARHVHASPLAYRRAFQEGISREQ